MVSNAPMPLFKQIDNYMDLFLPPLISDVFLIVFISVRFVCRACFGLLRAICQFI